MEAEMPSPHWDIYSYIYIYIPQTSILYVGLCQLVLSLLLKAVKVAMKASPKNQFYLQVMVGALEAEVLKLSYTCTFDQFYLCSTWPHFCYHDDCIQLNSNKPYHDLYTVNLAKFDHKPFTSHSQTHSASVTVTALVVYRRCSRSLSLKGLKTSTSVWYQFKEQRTGPRHMAQSLRHFTSVTSWFYITPAHRCVICKWPWLMMF